MLASPAVTKVTASPGACAHGGWTRAWLCFGLLAALGCVSVEGGAVEVSWVVHSSGGYALSGCGCAEPPIDAIRLDVRPAAPAEGLASLSYLFGCSRKRGATPFEIPPGRYAVSITALDGQGQAIAAAVTPPPRLATVEWGKPASMDAQLVVAPCAERCANKNGRCEAQ